MEILSRRFSELTTGELYALLKLRQDVFIVEQNCPYADADDRDQDAVHVLLREEGRLLGCLRVLAPGVASEYAAIGRVISADRRRGLGSVLLREGVRQAVRCFGAEKVYLEAQSYAVPFYERQGFRVCSGEFLEDGIPHRKMLLDIRDFPASDPKCEEFEGERK